MRALEKLRVYLAGEGTRYIKPPRLVIGGFDDRLRVERKPLRNSNVIRMQKTAEK